ncbi:hypothetical protein KM043_010421 [Ampulex compressa]|nr:hypothetical protein KM043_010421 [Ampulex compressa]
MHLAKLAGRGNVKIVEQPLFRFSSTNGKVQLSAIINAVVYYSVRCRPCNVLPLEILQGIFARCSDAYLVMDRKYHAHSC